MAEPQALQRGFGKFPIHWFRKQPIKLTDGFGESFLATKLFENARQFTLWRMRNTMHDS